MTPRPGWRRGRRSRVRRPFRVATTARESFRGSATRNSRCDDYSWPACPGWGSRTAPDGWPTASARSAAGCPSRQRQGRCRRRVGRKSAAGAAVLDAMGGVALGMRPRRDRHDRRTDSTGERRRTIRGAFDVLQESTSQVVVIATLNRLDKLDAALESRFQRGSSSTCRPKRNAGRWRSTTPGLGATIRRTRRRRRRVTPTRSVRGRLPSRWLERRTTD